MKKYLIIFILFFVPLCAGMYWFVLSNQEPKFFWGVHTNPYVFNQWGENFDPQKLPKQTPYWKDLGVNIIRFNFEHNAGVPDKAANDAMVRALTESKITPYMIIEHPFKDFFKEATYQKGYDWGNAIASQYKGQIKYYQLANEVSGTVIKPNFPGNSWSDYDQEKYPILRDYLQGLSAGINAADPKAKRVITAHWIGVAMMDQILKDNIPFEIIGWNWYSEMGDDLTNKKMDDGTILDIPGRFASYKKPFWIVEVNRSAGDWDDPTGQEQASYINTLATNSIKSGKISGFIVFKLFDSQSADGGKKSKDNSLGLITDVKETSMSYGPGSPKAAYIVYKKLISNTK